MCRLPQDTGWLHVFGIGLLGGIGFTVSLLISDLAFSEHVLVDEAKLGILAASIIAGVAGFVFLRLAEPSESLDNDNDASDAERLDPTSPESYV
jgi:NhaA family Na+:H+ antiporter